MVKVILSVEALEPQLSGIGRYSWELSQRLGPEMGIESLLFYRNGHWIPDPAKLCQPQPPPLSKAQRWLKRRSRPPQWLRDWNDRRIARDYLFHGPNYFLPPLGEGGVITVHDLSIFRFPETHPVVRREYFDRHFARSLELASHVVTDSATTREEVIADLGLDPARVTAIHLGVSPQYRPRTETELAPVLSRYGLTMQGYALCVSTVEPRKRITELLHAWAALPPAVRQRWPLMVTGGSGWLSDAVTDMMDKGGREGWVRYLGFVPEDDLPSIYAGAALFVYPSIYEGFGLPPIEAMASGVPVVVANASCLPEVTGGAAMLAMPEDIADFTDRLEQALADEVWRGNARAAGLEVAAGYGWDRCAAETAALYRRLG